MMTGHEAALDEEKHEVDICIPADEQISCELPQKDGLPALNGGHGWIVLAAVVVLQLLVGGWSRAYGVLYVEVRARYDSSAAVTAWIGGTQAAVRMLTSPLGTWLSTKLDSRLVMFCGGLALSAGAILNSVAPNALFLFFSHGLVCGVGGALVYAPSLVLVGQYFQKHLGLAQGLATGGSGTGLFIFPMLMDYLFTKYGYMGSLWIMGAILLHCCVAASLCRPLILNMDHETRRRYMTKTVSKPKIVVTKKKYIIKAVRNAYLLCFKDLTLMRLSISLCFVTLCYIPSHMLIVDMAITKGVPMLHASRLVSIIGITDMMGGIIFGMIYDCPQIRPHRLLLYNFMMVLIGLSGIGLIFCTSFWSLAVMSALHGLICGSVTGLRVMVTTDLLGVDRLAHSFGITVFAQGIGLLIGPAFAGFLNDISGSYTWSYVFSSGCAFIAAIVFSGNHYTAAVKWCQKK